MSGRKEIMAWLDGLADPSWRLFHSDSEVQTIAKETLDLLKEQEAVEPNAYMDGLVQRFTCGKCGKHLLYAKWGRDDFCSKCGQAVKWERNTGSITNGLPCVSATTQPERGE